MAVSSTEEVLKPAEGKEKVLFKYYAAAAWMWCLNEVESALTSRVM